MEQNIWFDTLLPHLPAYICVFGIASGVYLLQYHRDSGDTNIQPLMIPRGQWWNEWNIPTCDNKVYIDDNNTWEQLRRDCVNIYWKDHIWPVENENVHATGNLIYYLAFHGQSQTWMKTSLNWMDHMRACKPNLNGNKLEWNRSLQICCILSKTFIWLLHYTTMQDWSEINRHWRQYEMNSQTLTNSKWNYDKWMAHKRELSDGQLLCSGNATTKNLHIHRMTWKPRRLIV